jgi:hypothetical protein
VIRPGLRWIVLAVVVSVPWTRQRWAVPFLCVLATPPKSVRSWGSAINPAGYGLVRSSVCCGTGYQKCRAGCWASKLLGARAYRILERGRHCTRRQISSRSR